MTHARPVIPLIVDVRSPGEFATGHVRGSINIPLDRFADDIANQVPDKTTAVILCCASGGRSGMACNFMQQLGYQHVSNGGSAGAVSMQFGLPIDRL
ncbi:rhodanese-like domain-containing protein [Limnohabitans radicicola]|uniref:Rhodanese-like domain-containing protein n=1 Tax=Limnohabitans radicicola TaxID=2771427 RepID=A0A927ILZ8_9BURK|nr:rhodanese-like domain-containing protein [Limnohabitans radicicola]MBD8050661.1 rhodanese-like domain-containing protein [Limnohabitans radicicola]